MRVFPSPSAACDDAIVVSDHLFAPQVSAADWERADTTHTLYEVLFKVHQVSRRGATCRDRRRGRGRSPVVSPAVDGREPLAAAAPQRPLELQHPGGTRAQPHLPGGAGGRRGCVGEVLPAGRLLRGAADTGEWGESENTVRSGREIF